MQPFKNKIICHVVQTNTCMVIAVVRRLNSTKLEKKQYNGEQNTETLARIAQADEGKKSFSIHLPKYRPTSRRIYSGPLEMPRMDFWL